MMAVADRGLTRPLGDSAQKRLIQGFCMFCCSPGWILSAPAAPRLPQFIGPREASPSRPLVIINLLAKEQG